MFDKVYKSYKQKCKELGLKPSSKEKLFGDEIERVKNTKRRKIDESTAKEPSNSDEC
jgi:phage/plasmid-associated DNA primase